MPATAIPNTGAGFRALSSKHYATTGDLNANFSFRVADQREVIRKHIGLRRIYAGAMLSGTIFCPQVGLHRCVGTVHRIAHTRFRFSGTLT
jgi:hypothetical protein